MNKVLIINGSSNLFNEKCDLNAFLINKTKELLERKGYEVIIHKINNEYDPILEVELIVLCDIIIFQYPIWWFNVPWPLKKWIDEIFMAGLTSKKMASGDGRSKNNPNKKYGSGGLMKEKKYMLSVTMNAPEEAFDDGQFLSLGLNNLLSNMHKTFQFFGMQPMESFMCNDVIKNYNSEYYEKKLEKHINKNF